MQLTTILLDLDDTLLNSHMQQFASLYLQGLGEVLSAFSNTKRTIELVMQSVEQVQNSTDFTQTNEQVFYQSFFSRMPGDRTAIEAEIARYYVERYPRLQQIVSPIPTAPELVAHLFETGYRVAIATNPIFPQTAVEQRLTWAGVLNYPYALVTTLENMHACKPHPEYYQEILTKLNVPAAQCLMVGDNPTNDIIPAHSLGINTWWITDHPRDDFPAAGGQGSLSDLLTWLQSGEPLADAET